MAHGFMNDSTQHLYYTYQILHIQKPARHTVSFTFLTNNNRESVYVCFRVLGVTVQDSFCPRFDTMNSSFPFRVISVERCSDGPRERQKLASKSLFFLMVLAYHQLYFCRHSFCNHSRRAKIIKIYVSHDYTCNIKLFGLRSPLNKCNTSY